MNAVVGGALPKNAEPGGSSGPQPAPEDGTARRNAAGPAGPAGPAGTDGFALVRMAAATAVLVDHAVPLTGNGLGLLPQEWLGINLGAWAVSAFMAISGYFVCRSWERDPSVWRYLVRRFLRIYPALVVLLLLTVFALGPWVTSLPVGAYFAHPLTWDYLTDNLMVFPTAYFLPGVFEGSPNVGAVNGSLWSLPVEVFGYGLVVVLGVVGGLRHRWMTVAAALLCSTALARFMTDQWNPGPSLLLMPTKALLQMVPIYLYGMALYLYRDRVRLSWWGVAACVGVEVVFFGSPLVEVTRGVTLAYLPLAAGALLPRRIPLPATVGLASYGVYLYGFPVEQLLVWYGVRDMYLLMLLATVVTLPLAMLSWRLVERPAMEFRSVLFRRARVWRARSRGERADGQPAAGLGTAPVEPRTTSSGR
ncbi:acyltransferase family protein [Yinghuangia seranimata]|uniref:acyltransferase family protein n=1 Tax=Yinghuangia seranimata TaxID=408067 RepID=UPI00248C1693|nr:acyltransferase [Yinghuangia seranimata]MDI2131663.1 acyltransferase [Yinghuangia seranimata]